MNSKASKGQRFSIELTLLIKSFSLVVALVSAVLVVGSPDFAQAADFNWAIRAGGTASSIGTEDSGRAIATDSSGSVYVTGEFEETAMFGAQTLTSSGWSDVFVAKLDAVSNVLWAVSAGGSGTDIGRGIATDASGNVYVTGRFSGTATFGAYTLGTPWGNPEIFVAKLDSSGNFLWAVSAGGTLADEGYAIATDESGNVYITGSFWSMADSPATFGSHTLTSSGNADVFVAKLDSSGNFLWATKAGGTHYDEGYGIATEGAGSVYVTGYFEGMGTFGTQTLSSYGNEDIFVTKLDSSGSFLWAHKAGGSDEDKGLSIAIDGLGSIYMTGHFHGPATFGSTTLTSYYDGFLTKLDASGNFTWTTQIPTAYGVATDGSTSVLVVGTFIGTRDFGSQALVSSGRGDAFVTGLDLSGNFVWAQKAGGSNYDYARAVAADGSGNLYITGDFEDTATFGADTLVSAGGTDVFVAKLVPASPSSISVTPASQDFGTVEVGSTVDRTFTVENTGGGTLSGSASISSPYSIVSGGSYSLSAGASQTVTVQYSPTSAGTHNATVTFTGGGGAARSVSGYGQPPPPHITGAEALSGNQVILNWTSISGATYSVYGTSNLLEGFGPLHTDIPCDPPLNTLTTTCPQGAACYFYSIHGQ